MDNKFSRILVTVGTTQFNELINFILKKDILKILRNKLHCNNLIIQYGKGPEPVLEPYDGIKISSFDLKTDLNEDIMNADLIISHCGAGTCIDVLSKGKPMIAVINDRLMNNHQEELAEQLAKDNYLYCTTVNKIADTFENLNIKNLKKYEEGNVKEFVKYLDNFMGFN